MSILSRFRIIGEEEKDKAVKTLVERSTPDFDFFFMMTLAVLMAALGLLSGSETIVIGSMLIAPLLYPVLGVSLGLSLSDLVLMRHSLATLLKAAVIGVAAAALAALFYSSAHAAVITPEILLRTAPTLPLLAIAVISALAMSYALARPKLSETLPGIAISVALIPPLAVIGIGLAWLNLSILIGALGVFLLNIIGIVATGLVSFSLMDVHRARQTAETTLKKEEQRVEQEAKKVERVDAASKPGA